jgi:sugar phosphate isomerase/epimerase
METVFNRRYDAGESTLARVIFSPDPPETIMPRHRLAVATAPFSQPLRQSIQTASRIGAQGIHLNARNEVRPTDLSDTGLRQFLHELTEDGLSVASLSFPTRRSFYDQDQLEARVSAAKIAMDFARSLNANVLTLRVGTIPSETDSNEYRLLIDVLNELARHGNHVGTTISITPTREKPDQLIQLVSAVIEGPCNVDFDPARFAMAGINASDAFRELHRQIGHIRIRDGVRDIDGSGQEVPVGRGDVDWDELLAMIDESSYRGWLTVERTTGEDRILDAHHALQFVQNVARGA